MVFSDLSNAACVMMQPQIEELLASNGRKDTELSSLRARLTAESEALGRARAEIAEGATREKALSDKLALKEAEISKLNRSVEELT